MAPTRTKKAQAVEPEPPTSTDEVSIRLPASVAALTGVADSDRGRYSLDRVEVSSAAGRGLAVATDGKGLAALSWDEGIPAVGFPRLLVPARTLASVARRSTRPLLLRAGPGATARLSIDGGKRSADFEPADPVSFPPWRDVLPKEAVVARFACSLVDLRAAASAFELTDGTSPARVEGEGVSLVLRAWLDASIDSETGETSVEAFLSGRVSRFPLRADLPLSSLSCSFGPIGLDLRILERVASALCRHAGRDGFAAFVRGPDDAITVLPGDDRTEASYEDSFGVAATRRID